MKWWWISIVWAVLLPQVSWAETDCVVPNRLERVIDALDRVLNNPQRIITGDNLSVITNELRYLTLPNVTTAIFEELSPSERQTVLEVISAAQWVTARSNEDNDLPVSTKSWTTTLGQAKAILSELPCLESNARSQGDGEGRNASPTENAAESGERSFAFEVENLPEKAAAGVATTTILVGALLLILPWLKRRSQLRRRRAKRFGVSLDTTVTYKEDRLPGEIVNISCNGAKVRYFAKTPIDERQTIELSIDDVTQTATVVWSNNLFLGVKFDAALPIAFVRRLAGVGRFDALGRQIAKK